MDEKTHLNQVTQVLDQVIEDTSVPRNIRRNADEAKKILLKEDEDIGVRTSSAIYILEEVANDRNLPLHTRTLIWNIASELETF